MLERCWLAQWRGLGEIDRKMVDRAWSNGVLPPGYAMSDQYLHTLWGVEYESAPGLALITLKS